MRPVRVVEGRMAPLDRADVDTDQIMPKQFLKRIERTGFGEFLFHDWRADPGFVLNDPRYAGASVLVTGPNFGSGSSREHAPWGLQQYGFEAIVAPSFADILRSNCAKIGLLTVVLPPAQCQHLIGLARSDPQATVRIDLGDQTVQAAGLLATFDIDPHTKHLLVEGLDDVALTLARSDAIAAFEARRAPWLPVAAP
ncbi:MAG TPA: 3-isopropylmalate dehydratase small subunit [Egibacteraceae bacterium]|nr:3-isopropylmalate dehydratase small subunit [Actinomycetota bacterium]HWB71258.1 3-isopropylmalate dehydratase small subunit [Egibacteraceae bacterium]